jgi:hypothetical protein
MTMHLGAFWVQMVSKIHLGGVQILWEFSRFFWNLFSFSSSYFYLLEGSKIFFVSTKYFICIVCVLICLWEFFWNFCDFWNIFRDFKQFPVFTGIFSQWKIILGNKKKSYPFLPGRAPKPNPLQPSGQAAKGQTEPSSKSHTLSCLGRTRQHRRRSLACAPSCKGALCLYKGYRHSLARPSRCHRLPP